MKTIAKLEEKEPNKEEIQKILKQNILKLFAQAKKGCKRNICYKRQNPTDRPLCIR